MSAPDYSLDPASLVVADAADESIDHGADCDCDACVDRAIAMAGDCHGDGWDA